MNNDIDMKYPSIIDTYVIDDLFIYFFSFLVSIDKIL